MPSYNNVQTSAGYQEFRWPRSQQVTIAVSNAPILAKFILTDGSLNDAAAVPEASERDMQNGIVWTWTLTDFPGYAGIVGVQIKSEIAASPAVVTIHA